jgi:hypothetical protein
MATPIPVPAIKAESLDRWRRELSVEVQRQIATIAGVPPDICLSP